MFRMTVGKKIATGFGVAMAILLVIGLVCYRSTTEFLKAAERRAHAHSVLEVIGEIDTLLADAQRGERGFVLTGDEPYLDPYQNATETIPPALQKLRDLVAGDSAQQDRLAKLEPLIRKELDELKNVIDLSKSAEGLEAGKKEIKRGEGKKLLEAIRGVAAEMRKEENEALKKREDEVKSLGRTTLGVISYGTIAALVLTSLAGYLIVRSITGPVRQLVEGAGLIGKGKLDHRIELKTQDEMAELAAAFNEMTGNLRNTIESEKSRRARVEKLLENIREAVTRLASGTAEILTSTTEQAAGAQEQAAAVSQTVATVDEVTQTSDQSAQRAKSVGEAVQRTQEIGKAGRKVVEDSIAALGTVRERVEATAENILALAEQAQAIGEIIATVNDIAEQTNLLALNAAIKASRAGEHGKGFSVVAGEVKALADQSKKATAQVRQILGEIQKATNTAVLSTEEVTKGVAAAAKVSDQAGKTIETLADTLAEAARATVQIVASAGQQATGMAQIHQAMRNIDQVAKQNLAAMRQTEQAAQNLNALGTQLAELSAE
jgi:methyl-accepting chemotaxis protein